MRVAPALGDRVEGHAPTGQVSVAMAVYNGRSHLPEQVASILAQLEPGDELVVVDDGSTDGSREWLAAVADPRLRLHLNEANEGIAATFERALRLTRHPIVFLSDQDDVWVPGKRAAMVEPFERDPSVLVVVSDAELIDARGTTIAPSFFARKGGFHGGWWSTVVRNRYLGCAMAVRRTFLQAALPFPATSPMHDIWLGALGSLVGRTVAVPQAFLRWRRHDRNATSTRGSLLFVITTRLGLLLALATRMAALRLGMHRG